MSKEIIAKVIQKKMQKTVVLEVPKFKVHPLYGKTLKRQQKIYAHDELETKVGDLVRVVSTRPLSKLKRFKVLEVVKSTSKEK